MPESKSMDVSKPGKTAPDTTARPVIVGHKPLLKQDPMVNQEDSQGTATKKADEKPLTSRSEKVITPPASAAAEVEKKEPEVATTTEESKEPTNTTAPTESANEESSEPPVSNDAAVVDALAEQANANKKKPGEQTEEEKKRQEQVEKLIEEKKYFIPIKVASSKRHARWNIAILCLPVLGVVGYLLVDAGLVGTNVKLPIEFIKDSSAPTVSVQSQAPTPQTPPPQPIDNTYTSKVDAFSFVYPLTWKLSQVKEGTEETLVVSPPDPVADTNSLYVGFSRNKNPTSLSGNNTIAKVDYTAFTVGTRTLYLREVIYKNKDNRFFIRTSVADAKLVDKAGDPLAVPDTTFLAKDGKTNLVFHVVGTNFNDGRTGFSSLEAASIFTETEIYKSARNILLSLKL